MGAKVAPSATQSCSGEAAATANGTRTLAYKGGELQMFEPGTNRLTLLHAGNNQAQYESFLTLGFGGSGRDLAKAWNVTDQGTEVLKDGAKDVTVTKLDLVAKDPANRNMFSHITIWVDPVQGVSYKQVLYPVRRLPHHLLRPHSLQPEDQRIRLRHQDQQADPDRSSLVGSIFDRNTPAPQTHSSGKNSSVYLGSELSIVNSSKHRSSTYAAIDHTSTCCRLRRNQTTTPTPPSTRYAKLTPAYAAPNTLCERSSVLFHHSSRFPSARSEAATAYLPGRATGRAR